MDELYGGREAEIVGSLKNKRVQESRDRESAEDKWHKNCGTSERILGCLTVRASWNQIFMQQSRIVLSSTLALPFCIALVFLLVSAGLFQGAYSHTGKHMRGRECVIK